LKKRINLSKSPANIELYVAGDILTKQDENAIRNKMKTYGLQNVKLIIHVTPDIDQVKAEPDLLKQLLIKQEKKIEENDSLINNLKLQLDSLKNIKPDSLKAS